MFVRARVLLTTAVALAVVGLMAVPAGAAGWHFETLDGASSTGGRINRDVGQFSSTVIYGGTPHVFYRNAQDGTLRHAMWNGSAWAFETLDGAGGPNGRVNADVGADVKAIVFNGQVHVFYYDVTNGNLRHAAWLGSAWAFETLDGAGGANGRVSSDVGTDLAVVNFGAGPHVFYYDAGNKELRHAAWLGSAWGFETLDGGGGPNGRVGDDVGQYTSVVLWGAGPHVFYYDDTATTLRHAAWTGTTWAFEALDGLGGAGGRVNESVGSDTTATVYQGGPHVWYYDIDKGDLRHAAWLGSKWAFETLDGSAGAVSKTAGDVGTYASVTLFDGQPHILYRDETGGDLRHAAWLGSSWAFETLDGSNAAGAVSQSVRDVGMDNSAVNYFGLHIFSYDKGTGDLRHVWFG